MSGAIEALRRVVLCLSQGDHGGARTAAEEALAAQGVPAGWKLAGYLYDFKDNGVTIPDFFTSRKAEAEAPGHFNVRDCYTPAPPQAQQKTVCPYCQSEWVTGDQHDANLAAHLKREAQAQKGALSGFDAEGFRDWVKRNIPDETYIISGAWWADHLTEWAQRFVKAPPQAQQAEPLTVPHPASEQASKAIDAELEARGWPSNTKNAARAGYEACRKLAGIGASSGSAS